MIHHIISYLVKIIQTENVEAVITNLIKINVDLNQITIYKKSLLELMFSKEERVVQ